MLSFRLKTVNIRLTFPLLIFISGGCLQTQASEVYFSDDVPIVLSATRLAQPQTEAPASLSIIDREMIKLSGAKEIAEVFRLVPGMHVNYFRGNRATVGYQGLNSDYPRGVQVLIDGRSIYSPVFGGVDWANLPISLEDIERIEIIRGPNSASYGANAFQSVINISTSHSSQLSGFYAKSTVGERGYQRNFIRAGLSQANINFRISASHTDNNGYTNNHDDTRQDKLNTRLDLQLTARDSFQFNASAISSLKETANPGNYSDPFDPRRNVDEKHVSLHGKWEHNTLNNSLFITQLSYTNFKSTDRFSSTFKQTFPAPVGLVNDISSHLDMTTAYSRLDFEFEHQLQPSATSRLTWGIGIRSGDAELPFWTNTEQKHNDSMQRIFSNLEWRPLSDVIFNFSTLAEHSQLSGDELSPRLAINYLITPKQSLRFIASHSFRTPAVVEHNANADLQLQASGVELLIPVLRGASDISAETIDSFELGYHQLLFNNALTLDIKVFRNEYEHLIDTKRIELIDGITANGLGIANADVSLLDNLNSVDINGYEIEVNFKPNKNNLLHIAYSHNQPKGSEDAVESVPRDTFSVLASHNFTNQYWASVAYYYTGSMENLNSGNPLGPMRKLNFNLGKKITISPRQSLEIDLTLELALDKNKDFLKEYNLDNRAFIQASYAFL